MPLNLSAMRSNSATARVDYGADGDINVTYRPANLTERTIARLRAVEDADAPVEERMATLNAILRQLVVAWDLERDGVPVPLTDDALADVPMDVRADVLRAILRDGGPADPTSASDAPTPSLAPSATTPRSSSGRSASRRSRRS